MPAIDSWESPAAQLPAPRVEPRFCRLEEVIRAANAAYNFCWLRL